MSVFEDLADDVYFLPEITFKVEKIYTEEELK